MRDQSVEMQEMQDTTNLDRAGGENWEMQGTPKN